MKASEMTNEELASKIGTEAARDEVMFGETKGREMFAEICAEAAKRLRRPTPVDDDLLKMARDIDAKNAEIAELERKYADACKCCDDAERRLKVAEKALVESLNYNNSEELRKAQRKAKNALAAIRGEGGNDEQH